MHASYDDILSRINTPPICFEEHAVPRYCAFEPVRCRPGIHIGEIVHRSLGPPSQGEQKRSEGRAEAENDERGCHCEPIVGLQSEHKNASHHEHNRTNPCYPRQDRTPLPRLQVHAFEQ